MDIIDTPQDLREHRGGPVCVMAGSVQDECSRAAVTAWDLQPSEAEPSLRRPGMRLAGAGLDVVLLVLGEEREQHPLRMIVGADGMLLLADEPVHALVHDAVQDADGVWSGVVEVVLAVSRHAEEELDRLEDRCEELEDGAGGFTSSPQRRTMGGLRADVFRIQEVQATLHRLTSADEELAQSVPESAQRRLHRAAAVFDANRSAASRLYALLGDLLAEQGALVSERLTLVATIFLPLSLATGFFGMNFSWMQEHIGSMWAFLLLGVLLPALAALATLGLVRRLTRSS